MAAILPLHFLQKKITPTKYAYFSKMYYHASERKKKLVLKCYTGTWNRMNSFEQPRQGEDFREIRCGGEDWVHLAQDGDLWRVFVNRVMNSQVPYKAGNFLTV
jgi:hypothetical protein